MRWTVAELTDNPLVFVQALTDDFYLMANHHSNPEIQAVEEDANRVKFAGRIYTVPKALGELSIEDWRSGEIGDRPGVTVAFFEPDTPNLLYCFESNLLEYDGMLFAVPHALGEITEEQWHKNLVGNLPGVFTKPDVRPLKNFREKNIIELSTTDKNCRTIEYPGHHKLFDQIGACGTHPQFRHLSDPPKGYTILPSENGQSLDSLKELDVLWEKFSLTCLESGASKSALDTFLETRPLGLQKDIGCKGVDFIFYPSVPLHIGQRRWVIEIEDSTTLFFPFMVNGKTSKMGELKRKEFYPIIKNLVENEACKAIITHVKSTADSLSVLFDKNIIAPKVFHVPMGIPTPPWAKVVSLKNNDTFAPKFLISNSWHQHPDNFYLRGGLDSIRAFSAVKDEYPNAELTIRAKLPVDLPETTRNLIEDCKVRVVDDFLPNDEWEEMKCSSNFFLLPSARIHIVSMLEAMAYGMIFVGSDGWGIEEYATDGSNAILVAGRRNISYVDPESGILSEDYAPMYSEDLTIVKQLVEKIMSLIRDPKRQGLMREAARRNIVDNHSVQQFNSRLGEVLDTV
jgi:glycosyltransferase involved in cell wall biosynthesis